MKRLGAMTSQHVESVPISPTAMYSNLGVKWYAEGTFQRESKQGSQIKAKKLFRVRPGQFVYNRLFATEGSFAVIRDEDATAVASNEFPVFDVDENQLLVEYLYLYFNQPEVWSEVSEQCVGTTKSRLRWKEERFRSFVLPTPPVQEQQRIVDLISAVDDVIAALETAINAAGDTRRYLLEGLLARLPDETLSHEPLGALGEFIRGRRFVKSDYVDEGLGCIHYGQIHTHYGSSTDDTLTFIPESMKPRMRLALPGDVVIAATSEDVEGLGKATAWLGDDEVAVHDDCQIFRHRLDPRYASHLFATEAFQQQKVQFAAGTKVTRISGENLARILVPVPLREEQEVIGATMSDFDSTVSGVVSERDNLRTLRSDLLTVLLSGEHAIPESYDELTAAT